MANFRFVMIIGDVSVQDPCMTHETPKQLLAAAAANNDVECRVF